MPRPNFTLVKRIVRNLWRRIVECRSGILRLLPNYRDSPTNMSAEKFPELYPATPAYLVGKALQPLLGPHWPALLLEASLDLCVRLGNAKRAARAADGQR